VVTSVKSLVGDADGEGFDYAATLVAGANATAAPLPLEPAAPAPAKTTVRGTLALPEVSSAVAAGAYEMACRRKGAAVRQAAAHEAALARIEA
jgi:hypothetical protein